MDILDTLVNRRSVKKYTDQVVDDASLEKIITAGLYAPSGKNGQKVMMMVVKNRELVKKLSKLNSSIMGLDIDPFYNAPVVVVVFADRNYSTYLEDGSLVLGNMMNEAFSIGVDSCWIHRAKEMFELPEGRAIAKANGIPDEYIGIGNCILGYRSGAYPEAKPRREGRVIIVE